MAKIFAITSAKGGVGKSTSAINLAAALNSLKEDVLIVDANLATPNVGLHFGAPIVPVSLNHVLLGKANVDDAIYVHESGTKILPSSISVKEIRKLKHDRLRDVINEIKKKADYVILDSAAGLGEEALAVIKAADELIVVTNPEMPAVTDALKTIKLAEDLGRNVRGVIITRVRDDKTEMSLHSVRDMLELPILGIVPEDKAVREALAMKNPVVYSQPRSKSARAYRKIASRLAGKRLEKTGFYSRILRIFGL